MDDQEARSLIASQRGSNLLEREANAVDQLRKEEDLAKTSFYSTISRLIEYYGDFPRHHWTDEYMRGLRATEEQINAKVDQLAVITNEEADEEEIREVDHIVDTSAFKMEVAIDRSRALAAYIHQQQQAVQA